MSRTGIQYKCLVALTFALYGLQIYAATPQVKNVKAMEQYPWGKVYISYDVVGDIAASATMTPFLAVSAINKTTGSIYASATTLDTRQFLSGDTGIAAGQHKIVWDIGAQGVTISSTNVAFAVAYTDELYLVVDLSSGSSASSYPTIYLTSSPSGGFNVDAYKTTKLVLRYIEAGSFMMGGSVSTTLSKPFFCGLFEVTQKQYSLVMGSNPSNFSGNKLPVEKVSYNAIRGTSNGAKWPSTSAVDSVSFIGKLRARTGLDFDLPTEAQWEYVCRAGTTTTYSYGNSASGNYMWFRGNCYGDSTQEVGTRPPNSWGLYDIHGNVCEWCLDWYTYNLSGGTDPKGPSSGTKRIVRGGSWNHTADSCTSSCRASWDPSGENNTYGFRLVRTLSN
jgi:formylglycine-generating enzyme required for sulfatase activity